MGNNEHEIPDIGAETPRLLSEEEIAELGIVKSEDETENAELLSGETKVIGRVAEIIGEHSENTEQQADNNDENNVTEKTDDTEQTENADAVEAADDAGLTDTTDMPEDEPDDFEPVSASETPKEQPKPKKPINVKKIAAITGIVAGAVAVIYLGGVLFYSGHYFYGTAIGGFDCSNMTVEKAAEAIEDGINNYSFTFYERDGREESITGSEIYLEHSPVKNLDEVKEGQNAFAWPVGFFNPDESPLDIDVSYNTDSLYNRITEMEFMKESRDNLEGGWEKIKYVDGQYTVEDDGVMNSVSISGLFNKVKPKISELYAGMSLEKEGCYGNLAEDDAIKGVLSELNRYVGTKVTYKKGEADETYLDGGSIHEWLKVGEDYSVNIDTDKVKEYINELCKRYDTVGTPRTYKTTGGSEVTIEMGNYGWIMDNEKEAEALVDIIKSGEQVEREPVYKRTAAAHTPNDIADTYVEVSISAQHMWYYKDGNLVVSTDVVTGNSANGHDTHKGVYYIAFKERNATLKGQGYSTPVSYWMPFYDGQGFHDANWRGSFGGSIYHGSGSHGCVNMPPSAAATLFQSISAGDPVIIY